MSELPHCRRNLSKSRALPGLVLTSVKAEHRTKQLFSSLMTLRNVSPNYETDKIGAVLLETGNLEVSLLRPPCGPRWADALLLLLWHWTLRRAIPLQS